MSEIKAEYFWVIIGGEPGWEIAARVTADNGVSWFRWGSKWPLVPDAVTTVGEPIARPPAPQKAVGDEERLLAIAELTPSAIQMLHMKDARISALEAQITELKADRPYIVGWNDGYDHAVGGAQRPCRS